MGIKKTGSSNIIISGSDKILGRVTAGPGLPEEIVCTNQGRSLLDDTTQVEQRTTLGLGDIATQNKNNIEITGGAITGITDIAVSDGGTGKSVLSPAYGVLCAGVTETSQIQVVSSVGNLGQVLKSNGSGVLPSWESVSGANRIEYSIQNTNALVINIDGETYKELKINISGKATKNNTGGGRIGMRINSDSGTNYKYAYYAVSTYGSSNGLGLMSNLDFVYLGFPQLDVEFFSENIMRSKSGFVRKLLSKRTSYGITGVAMEYVTIGWAWLNVADAITSFAMFYDNINTIDAMLSIEYV